MRARRSLLAGLLGVLSGVSACEVPSLPDRRVVAIRNVCETDASCEGGTCLAGICHASSTDITAIVVSISPADATLTSTLINLPIAPTGGVQRFDLLASPPVEVHVTARPNKASGSPTGCLWNTSAGGTVGMRAAFLPKGGGRGLPTRAAFVTGSPQPLGADPPEYWHLATLVAPGDSEGDARLDYDIYLSAIDDADCPIPPLLLRRTVLGNDRFDLKVGLESPRPLSGTVKLPPGASLEGFRVEIVDGATGVLISTVGSVSAAVEGTARFGVRRDAGIVPLEYFPPILPEGEPPKSPILRLVPPGPPSAPGPTLLWEVAVIDLDDTGIVALDVSDLAVRAITLQGRVERGDAPIGAAAQVFLRSRRGGIVGAATGVPAFFATSIQTTLDGVFSVDLPAGVYDVTAVPVRDESRTLARETFELAASPTLQAGRVLELPARPAIRATVVGRANEALSGVVVEAAPIAAEPATDVLEIARRDTPLSPSIQTVRTDASGLALLFTDATFATVTARPATETGFPWAILPRVSPSETAVDLRPSYPVELFGSVQGSSGLLPNATVQAFARLPSSTGDGELVLIAETNADENGSYRLLLPSRFSP